MAESSSVTQVDARNEVVATTEIVSIPLTLEEYSYSSAHRNRCIIINNHHFNYTLTKQSDREGTEVDAENIARTFMVLGFHVEQYNDLTVTDMSIVLSDASRKDYSSSDCFVCVILSHGEGDLVFGVNGTIKVDSLINRFKGDACPSLAAKPKLFFIQACRGRRYDFGVDIEDAVDSMDTTDSQIVKKIPVEADLLVAYSVVPGHFSWRNNVDGSWFIQALCRVLREHGKSMDLAHMMTIVNKVVAYEFQSNTDDNFTTGMKQVSWVVSTLTKLVYFRQTSIGSFKLMKNYGT